MINVEVDTGCLVIDVIEPNVVYQGIIYIYILLEKVELKIPDH